MNILKKKQDQKHLELLNAYRDVFGRDNGKLVIEDLIKTYIMRSSMGADSHSTAFKEGERNVVLKILTMLNINEDVIRERMNNVNKI